MAQVIGFDETKVKKFTCNNCGAIVRYNKSEEQYLDLVDNGENIRGLYCPNCGEFTRTNT